MQENFDKNEDVLLSNDEANESAPEQAQDKNATTEIIGVRFKKNGKTYYFAPNGFNLAQDTKVIVDTSRGQEYGFVAVPNRNVKNSQLSEPLRSVIRVATDEDTKIYEENAKKEVEAYNACIGLIDKHRLGMKLIDTELSFDRSKMLFYFSAEERVDFRELVKDLASSFHTRIEMRQIGIRDEAKLRGGLGICGRPYCCSSFLNDFGQVSVKMAKEQNLSLNTAKISGSCGRLMCCLRYEYDTYLAEKALTPKVDARVMTPSGAGTVTAANPLAGIIKVRLDSMGSESEPVLFVREDVMDESKYDGRPLTKTDIPKRGKKDDEMLSFADFSVSRETVNAPSATPVNAQTADESAARDTQGTEHQAKKHKHKKHKKKHSGQGQQQNSAPAENQPNQQGNGESQPAASQKKKKKFFRHHGKGGQKN